MHLTTAALATNDAARVLVSRDSVAGPAYAETWHGLANMGVVRYVGIKGRGIWWYDKGFTTRAAANVQKAPSFQNAASHFKPEFELNMPNTHVLPSSWYKNTA